MEEGQRELALEAVEGVMQLLQILVMTLGKSGTLDTAEYARLLADWRLKQVDADSIQEVLIDRMLQMLVDQPEVLVRRSGFQLITDGGHDPRPTPEIQAHPDGDA